MKSNSALAICLLFEILLSSLFLDTSLFEGVKLITFFMEFDEGLVNSLGVLYSEGGDWMWFMFEGN